MNIANRLLDWHKCHGRHDLPWQVRGAPYPVWVSEIMLQQTQVATVIPYYQRFMDRFPHIQDLAKANLDRVLHLWSGLGYYARARNMHKTAQIITDQFNGKFPVEINTLIEMPGIGKSTAGAILAQSLGQPHPILDGNVKRVLARYFMIDGWPGHRDTEKRLWQLSEALTPSKDVAEYTQAIMDLGATLCTRNHPRCTDCPIHEDCQAWLYNKVGTYPHKRPKKEMPVKIATFLLVRNPRGEIYLTQRPPSGIWGGLWCLPELQHEADMERHIENFPAEIETGQALPVVRHTFSHYHLDFTVIPATVKGNHADRIMETAPAVWYNPAQPAELGLAAPIKKIIHETEV
ncbi:MAG: A/G-specific adenine glycosylase [Pseudomonadota bacterium]|nr:A/G-specific adenine glycosylase [Pseudomonadota bacterium]